MKNAAHQNEEGGNGRLFLDRQSQSKKSDALRQFGIEKRPVSASPAPAAEEEASVIKEHQLQNNGSAFNGNHSPFAPAGLEEQIGKLEAERAELQKLVKEKDSYIANLASRNKHMQGEISRQHVYLQYLSQANAELYKLLTAAVNDLKSLQNARVTRLVKALRHFNLKELAAAYAPLSIEGNLDFPAGSEVLTGTLNASGWVISNAGKIDRVEAFLDETYLGELFYGVVRPDVVAARPFLLSAECGFNGVLDFDPAAVGTGVKSLKIRVTDSKGNEKEFTRLVIVEYADNLPVAINFIASFCRNAPSAVPELQREAYLGWIARNEPSGADLKRQRQTAAQWSSRPLISIVTPVYDPPPAALGVAIESVLGQTYENWELCLVDGGSGDPQIKDLLGEYARRDARIRVKFLESNLGIAGNSNEALEMARGEFVALLDHDDELSPDALYENVSLLNRFPETDMIYSDEDKLDEGGEEFNGGGAAGGARCEPFFKPEWSPDLFYSQMYTCHLGVYRRSLVEQIGGFRTGFDGAQDYDLVLRLIEQTDRIRHIPKVLYHWRKSAGSTALSPDAKNYAREAQIKAVAEHLERAGVKATVEPGLAENLLRVRRALPALDAAKPKVSIIIPTRDQLRLLRNCLESIQSRSSYLNYEIIIVDNNSSETETREYLAEISGAPGVRVLDYPHPFNFAGINNFAAEHADGELLLFLNNDTEVISEEWLEAMVEHALRPEVGAVGARLLYPNGMVQHAGVIIGVGGVAGHSHKFYPAKHPGYFSRAVAIQNLSAVTAACMMVRRETFKLLGGFNERDLPVAFNDVDFCLRVRQENLRVVYTPYAELYHHESVSRGSDHTPEKALRFQREVEYMLKTWKEILESDPYYSPNLTFEREDFSIAPVAKVVF